VSWKKSRHSQTICKALNIDVSDYEGIHIEQDHIITLFDIVLIVGTKMLSTLKKNGYLTVFDIASQVIKEHLDENNIIPTIALTTTHHEMRHSGLQTIKLEDINGNYKMFLDKYRGFIPEGVQDRINETLQWS